MLAAEARGMAFPPAPSPGKNDPIPPDTLPAVDSLPVREDSRVSDPGSCRETPHQLARQAADELLPMPDRIDASLCPACKHPLRPNAAICVECGLDLHSGVRLTMQTGLMEEGAAEREPSSLLPFGHSPVGKFVGKYLAFAVAIVLPVYLVSWCWSCVNSRRLAWEQLAEQDFGIRNAGGFEKYHPDKNITLVGKTLVLSRIKVVDYQSYKGPPIVSFPLKIHLAYYDLPWSMRAGPADRKMTIFVVSATEGTDGTDGSSIGKKCSKCNSPVSSSSKAGNSCPYCGVKWEYETGPTPTETWRKFTINVTVYHKTPSGVHLAGQKKIAHTQRSNDIDDWRSAVVAWIKSLPNSDE